MANALSRCHFDNLGEVYAQIGLDFAPCPGNCEFCSFGAAHGIVKAIIQYPAEDITRAASICEQQGANGIYLMTTARYPFEKFLEVAGAVRQVISPGLPMVANVADFSGDYARDLATVGFQAVYHAIRLNEGIRTAFTRKQRIRTIEAARKAGLNLHFCVEQVGPEQTIEEQVDLMFLGRDLGVAFSGAMRRVCVPGTRVADNGGISWWSLARSVAVCRLVMAKTVLGHCTHDPTCRRFWLGRTCCGRKWGQTRGMNNLTLKTTAACRYSNVEPCLPKPATKCVPGRQSLLLDPPVLIRSNRSKIA